MRQSRASAEVVAQLTYTTTSLDISTPDPNDVITWTLRQDPTNNLFVVSTDRPIRNRANTGTASALSETAWAYPFGFSGPGRQVSEPLQPSQIDSQTNEASFVPLGVAGEYFLLRYSVNYERGFNPDPGQREFCDGLFCGQASQPGTREIRTQATRRSRPLTSKYATLGRSIFGTGVSNQTAVLEVLHATSSNCHAA
jgi:hypothetical protein